MSIATRDRFFSSDQVYFEMTIVYLERLKLKLNTFNCFHHVSVIMPFSEEPRAIFGPGEICEGTMRTTGHNGGSFTKADLLAIDLYMKCVSLRYTIIYVDPSLPSTYTIPFVLSIFIHHGEQFTARRVYESLSSIVIEFHGDGDRRVSQLKSSQPRQSLMKKSTDREEFHGRVLAHPGFFSPVKFALNYSGESARAALIAYFGVDRYL